MMDERTKSFIHSAFDKALVDVRPYPHIVVENVLPEDEFNAFAANWPDPRHFTTDAGDSGRLAHLVETYEGRRSQVEYCDVIADIAQEFVRGGPGEVFGV